MKLISVSEAQRILGVSQPKMYEFCHKPMPWVVCMGDNNGRKKWKVNEDKVVAWIEAGGESH